jgi:hypothetical protein
VALLGWGLGGFALHATKDRFRPSAAQAGLFALLYALSIPLGLWLIVRTPFLPERVAFYFTVSLVPFLLAGVSLATVFDLHRAKTSTLYFADLGGAAAGALLVTLLLSGLGGELTVLAVSLLAAGAAICFWPRLAAPATALSALILVAAVTNERTGLFKIGSAPTKGLHQHLAEHPGARIELTGWNAYSRIDAVTGLPHPYLARLYIDSDAWTSVLRWDGRLASLAPARDWYRALPFKLAPERPQTLVIGPGGGSDVLVALAAGSEKVTAVELNPLMLRFVRHFGEAAGNVYDHPQVEAILSEGRTFVRRTTRQFDVILLGFVDSWAAVASGGLSLSENHLYTVEAFEAYYDRLTSDGLLVILRWEVDVPRLVSNTVAFLGAKAAAPRLLVLMERRETEKEPAQMIFALRKRPFTAEETAEVMGFEQARPVIVGDRHVDPPFLDLLAGRETIAEYAAEAVERVDPVTDNRPFFFARTKPLGLPWAMSRGLLAIFLLMLGLCVAFVARGRPPLVARRAYSASVLYFAGLGIGFIAVELALLQHLTLLLGHPIFTMSVLLSSLLLSSGLGASRSREVRPRLVCAAIAGLGALYALALPRLVPALLPLSLPARVIVALVLIAPLGFAMGMPFPRGLLLASEGGLPAPPFYWGLNGIFSVAGSLLTMVVAVSLGFTAAMLVGCAAYALAAAAAGSESALVPAGGGGRPSLAA